MRTSGRRSRPKQPNNAYLNTPSSPKCVKLVGMGAGSYEKEKLT